MGRHAAPRRTSSPVRRATAVSAGTLVLCLGGFAPGVAAAADPPPVPKPVSDLVQQVSNTTGTPNPIPPSGGAVREHRAPHRSTSTAASTKPARHVSLSRTSPTLSPPLTMPTTSLLARETALRASSLHAPVLPAVTTPAAVQPSSALQALPAPAQRDDAPRILLVAIATLILGGLASGHIKAAQAFVFAH